MAWRFSTTSLLSRPVYFQYTSSSISLISMYNVSVMGRSSSTNSNGTWSDVSRLIRQSVPHRRRNSRIKPGCSQGSPPPKVTPPPLARKYNSSILTCRYTSSGVYALKRSERPSDCGLRQYRHRSGQPWNATSVVTPSPSVIKRCRTMPMKRARSSPSVSSSVSISLPFMCMPDFLHRYDTICPRIFKAKTSASTSLAITVHIPPYFGFKSNPFGLSPAAHYRLKKGYVYASRRI